MTLTQLRYVITIADTGSMNEASKALFISQPSLSQAVKELETEIGVELFKRSNRGVSVTQEGIEFLGYARQVVEQYELIESHYIERKNVKKKFGVSMQHYTFAVNAFVEMVRQFGMDEYEFAVRETKTYEVIEDVKEFRSEIGIIYINDFNQKRKLAARIISKQLVHLIAAFNIKFLCFKLKITGRVNSRVRLDTDQNTLHPRVGLFNIMRVVRRDKPNADFPSQTHQIRKDLLL